jgi:anti-sigma factor RsiW
MTIKGATMASRACKKIFAALSEYIDGELPPRSCRELERHMAGCEPCLAYLETLRATADACRKYSEMESLAPPKEFVAKLRTRILSSAQARKPPKRKPPKRKPRR